MRSGEVGDGKIGGEIRGRRLIGKWDKFLWVETGDVSSVRTRDNSGRTPTKIVDGHNSETH